MRKSLAFIFAIFFSFIFLFTYQPSSRAQGEEIRIGWIGPLTGPMSAAGYYAQLGTEIAVNEINMVGGIKGRKLSVYFQDTAFSPANAVMSFERLVRQSRVVAILGDLSSSGTLATMNLAREYEIPQISYGARTPLINKDENPFVFTIVATSKTFYKSMVDHLVAQNVKRIAILGSSAKYSEISVQYLKQYMKESNVKHVNAFLYSPDIRDYTMHLDKIKQYLDQDNRADKIILTGTSTEAAMIIRQARMLGIKTTFVGIGSALEPDVFVEKLGGYPTNVEMFSDFSFEKLNNTALGKTFVQKLEKKHKIRPDFFSVMAYEATKVLAMALQNIPGQITGRSLRDQLLKTKNYQGLLGSISFSPTGEIERPIFIYDWKADGEFVVQAIDK